MTTPTFEERGARAYEQGARRIVPRDILVNDGTAPALAWYRGWDRANLADCCCDLPTFVSPTCSHHGAVEYHGETSS